MADISLGGSVGTTGTAILGNVTIAIPSDADYTLLVLEYTNQFLNVTSSVSLTATRNIIAPVVEGVTYIIQNNTTGSQNIQIIGSTGTGITIANGATVSVVCDGTNYLQSSGGGGSVVFAGDLSGNSSTQEVIGILNNLLPGLSDGYLNWNGSAWQFSPVGSGNFIAAGDLSGDGSSQEVVGILSNPLPSLSTGYLNWNGSSWLFSTLPTSLPPNGSAGGDLSGTYPNPNVAQIQGNPIQSGILGSAQDGYFFKWNNGSGYWEAIISDAAIPGTANEFTGVGTLTDIISSETIIASNTAMPVKSSICIITTTNATPTLIASFTPATNTVIDWSLSFVAVNTAFGGDFYRSDMSFTTVTTSSLTMYPTTPTAVNIRNAMGGFNYSVSATVSGNTVQISVTGVVSTTIDWSCTLQAQVVV